MYDSGATKHMTQHPAGLEYYVLAPTGHCVESAGGISLPMAVYGRLRVLVDQGTLERQGPND